MAQTARLLLALLAGIVIGAGAIPALRAQPEPRTAYVVEVTHVTEPAGFTEYVRHEPETLAAFHGRLVARAFPDVREGAPPSGTVAIAAFDNAQDANRWYSSPAYARLIPLRQKSAVSQVYILDGIH